MKDEFVVQDGYVFKEETQLTVLKTSLFFAGDGFSVYDCKGQLVFRVDSYGPDTRNRDEVVLMDPHGRCLLTLRRKRPSLHQRWEGFKGERTDGDKAIFSVKRSSIIGRSRASLNVEVYDKSCVDYQIEGCFSQRCCKVFNAAKKESVAQIRRKVDPTTSVMLGKEVFSLCVKRGFDVAFAMGLILALDQIDGNTYFDNGSTNPVVHPAIEESYTNELNHRDGGRLYGAATTDLEEGGRRIWKRNGGREVGLVRWLGRPLPSVATMADRQWRRHVVA